MMVDAFVSCNGVLGRRRGVRRLARLAEQCAVLLNAFEIPDLRETSHGTDCICDQPSTIAIGLCAI
jgi:hypothetical protein